VPDEKKKGIERAEAELLRARENRAKIESLRPEVTHLAARAAHVVTQNGFSDLVFNLRRGKAS
jgi:type II secretory pathway component PulM